MRCYKSAGVGIIGAGPASQSRSVRRRVLLQGSLANAEERSSFRASASQICRNKGQILSPREINGHPGWLRTPPGCHRRSDTGTRCSRDFPHMPLKAQIVFIYCLGTAVSFRLPPGGRRVCVQYLLPFRTSGDGKARCHSHGQDSCCNLLCFFTTHTLPKLLGICHLFCNFIRLYLKRVNIILAAFATFILIFYPGFT